MFPRIALIATSLLLVHLLFSNLIASPSPSTFPSQHMFSRLVGALKGSPATAASMKLHSPPSPTTNIAQQAQAALSSAAQGKQEIFTGANGCFWGVRTD